MTKISVIGSGIIGMATGIGFHTHGNEVIFNDIDEDKLIILRKKGYKVTRNISEAIFDSKISLICVPTPTLKGQIDLSYVESVIINIAKALRKKREYHVVVIRSTILPTTTHSKIVPLLRLYTKMKPGIDYGICTNPEFLREVNAQSDFLNPNRIVIGEFDNRSGNTLEELYKPFNAPIIRTDLSTAEMIKYISNIFLATKISFFNEFHIFSKALGLDPHFVAEVVAMDPRIGKYGIYGGRPFGGKCLPKDLEAFINFIKEKKFNPKQLDAVLSINNDFTKMKNYLNKGHEQD